MIGIDAESLGIGKVIPAGHADSFESRLLGSAVGESPSKVELADPLHYMRGGCPPFLILHGESDTLIPWTQSEYLFNALAAHGDEAILALFEKLGHGFFNNKTLACEDYGKVTVRIADFPPGSSSFTCDPGASIPLMVSAFFKTHLLPRASHG